MPRSRELEGSCCQQLEKGRPALALIFVHRASSALIMLLIFCRVKGNLVAISISIGSGDESLTLFTLLLYTKNRH